MRLLNILFLSLFILWSVEASSSLRRPECGSTFERNHWAGDYLLYQGSSSESSDGVEFRPKKQIFDWEREEINLDEVLRGLPNQTFFSVPDVIKYTGYPVEVHNVLTSDGYFLEMHRITGGQQAKNTNEKKIPVLLIHGLIESSGCWVLMGKELGLGFILADAGYDVWLGNVRGNRYSRRHVKYNPDGFHRKKFWSFSWHEIGTIDLPTMIDYILVETSSRKLHYIGHSQGTTAFFVMCAELPAYNDKIILMNALAPVALMGHVENIAIKMLVKMYPPLKTTARTLGIYELTLSNKFLARLSEAICAEVAPETPVLCSSLLFLIDAFNSKQINCTMIPVILGHTPAGASIQQYMHYAQNVRSKRFQKYDYDSALQNFKIYGKKTPPLYDLKNIRAPIIFFYAVQDSATNHADVDDLFQKLPNVKAKYLVQDPDFTHVDFVYGMFVRTLIYDKLVQLMKDADAHAQDTQETLVEGL